MRKRVPGEPLPEPPIAVEVMDLESIRDCWAGEEGVGAKVALRRAMRRASPSDILIGLQAWHARFAPTPAEWRFCVNLARWLEVDGWESTPPPPRESSQTPVKAPPRFARAIPWYSEGGERLTPEEREELRVQYEAEDAAAAAAR